MQGWELFLCAKGTLPLESRVALLVFQQVPGARVLSGVVHTALSGMVAALYPLGHSAPPLAAV